MKAKYIIVIWVVSLPLLATDNLILAFIAFCLLAFSIIMMKKNIAAVKKAIIHFENKLNKQIKNSYE